MDSKLLATLIALVKKETGAVSAQQQKRIEAASGSYTTLAVGDALPLSAATQVQLSANDIVDARIQVDQVVNGVGNGLVRRLRVLFGATATQVNHLAITRVG